MPQNTETPAAELLEQTLQQPTRRKKKDFIESLRHKRMLYLDRAAMCEELILELGGSIDEPMVDDMTTEDLDMPGNREDRPRRRHQPESTIHSGDGGRDMSVEGRPLTREGKPDLRFEENFDVRAEEAGQGEHRTSQTAHRTSHADSRRDHVRGASHEVGSSPEAEGSPPAEAVTVSGQPDKRYKANETEAEFQARHMLEVPEGTSDGRGEVRSEDDKRLKGNETEELSRARHMQEVPEGATDGRGEVTDPENDLRLKKNLGKRARIAAEQGKTDE